MLDPKSTRFALIILSVFLLFQTFNAIKAWQAPNVAYSTIVVSGEGEVFATPDTASFSFSVSADSKSVSEAQDAVTGKIDAITTALKSLGVKEMDIRTTDYSVYPKYHYEKNNAIPDGYTVTHSIMVKVKSTADAGKALAIAGDNGATNISSLSLSVDDDKAVMAEARDKAVQDARAKAKVLANSLGVHLGRVVDFSDASTSPGPRPIYSMEASVGGEMKSAPTIPVGQSKFTSNVSITYEIR